MIYVLAFSFDLWSSEDEIYPSTLQLLHCSRQTYAEGIPILYGKNIICLNEATKLLNGVHRINPYARRHIRKINVDMDDLYAAKARANDRQLTEIELLRFASRCPNLDTLGIYSICNLDGYFFLYTVLNAYTRSRRGGLPLLRVHLCIRESDFQDEHCPSEPLVRQVGGLSPISMSQLSHLESISFGLVASYEIVKAFDGFRIGNSRFVKISDKTGSPFLFWFAWTDDDESEYLSYDTESEQATAS